MTKRMIIMLVCVGVVLGGIFGFKMFGNMMMTKAIRASGFPPQTVSTIKATYQDWQPKLQAVGTLRAVNGADISSEVAGIVQTIEFESGGDVDKGAALVHLRADDDVAKLHALEATAKLAEITFNRDTKQLKVQAISQATVDNDAAALDSARAQVKEQQAIVDKKTILAPFAGHLGIRQIDIGQYLTAGTAIVTLQQLDPIYIDFALPEQDLPRLALAQKVVAKTDGSDQTYEGEITAVNAKIDETTRNIQVRAAFKNPDHKLLPGMFANVMVDVDKPVRYLTIPQTAIVYNTYGNAVYLVKPSDDKKDDGKPHLVAQQTVIITGETRGDQVAITSGVKDGDEVVTSGQVKLRNGVPVIVNNDVQPSNDANPHPHE